MTLGDYRDGSGLSFVPTRRKTHGLGIACATLLIVLGATGIGFGFHSQQTSDDIRANGQTAMGMLVGYGTVDDGGKAKHALVDFPVSGITTTGHSREPVAAGKRNSDGTVYTVYYDAEDPSKTFIDGIDKLDGLRLDIMFGSGSVLLLGLLMFVRPPGRQVRAPKVAAPGIA